MLPDNMLKIRNLIFEGGGVKGIAYVGALKAFEDFKGLKLTDIVRVGGASAGAITSLLVGLNYSVPEIEEELSKLDFRKFADHPTIRQRFKDVFGSGTNYLYAGDVFLNWAKEKIAASLGDANATFAQAKASNKCKDMYFIVTNLTKRRSETCSFEHTPDMPIAVAVRASMAIPAVFKPVTYSISATRDYDPFGTDVYVDGGVINNYPINLFDDRRYIVDKEYLSIEKKKEKETKEQDKDRPSMPQLQATSLKYAFYNKETWGFKVDSYEEIDRYYNHNEISHDPNGLLNTSTALLSIYWNIQDITRADRENNRTTFINSLNVDTTDFALEVATQKKLVQSGYEAAKKQLEAKGERAGALPGARNTDDDSKFVQPTEDNGVSLSSSSSLLLSGGPAAAIHHASNSSAAIQAAIHNTTTNIARP